MKPRPHSRGSHDVVVVGMRERGGDLRLIHIESNIAKHLGEQIRKHVSPDAEQVITDELPAYRFLPL